MLVYHPAMFSLVSFLIAGAAASNTPSHVHHDVLSSNDPNAWCPRYHTIFGHYDPSGPIFLDDTWHVFPDGA